MGGWAGGRVCVCVCIYIYIYIYLCVCVYVCVCVCSSVPAASMAYSSMQLCVCFFGISYRSHPLAMPGKQLWQDVRNAWVKRPLQPGRVAPECVWSWSNFDWAGRCQRIGFICASLQFSAWNRESESESFGIFGQGGHWPSDSRIRYSVTSAKPHAAQIQGIPCKCGRLRRRRLGGCSNPVERAGGCEAGRRAGMLG